MYPVWAFIGIGIIVWGGLVSYYTFRNYKFLLRLFPKSEDRDIRVKFEEVMKVLEETKRRYGLVDKRIDEIQLESLKYIGKVRLLRYNPYEDTGGNVSFTLGLLDAEKSGVIITSLHTRSGTRLYAKEVSKGKSNLQLSKEEYEVLKNV